MHVLLVIATLMLSAPAWASRFPPGSNVVDPRNYGAVPNDGLPDTAAFQAAASAAVLYGHIYEITGEPGDVYTIDGPIRAQMLHGTPPVLKWANNWIILCDPGVVIEVPAATAAFGNAAAPQDVFQFASTTNNAPSTGTGGGNEGYRNTFDGACEIRIGAGNPGARSAINWVPSNRAAIRGVTITAPPGQGTAGIWMGRPWSGPALIEGVTIDGFQRATWDGFVQYGITYRDVTIRNQTVYGIDATATMTSIEGLRSCNAVPALRVESGAGQLVLLDSALDCGAGNKPAIQLGATSRATLQGVTASGYQLAVRNHPELGLDIDEWASHPTFSYDGSKALMLRLPKHAPPRPFDTRDWSQWADPRAFGADPNDQQDDLPGILAAIASGRPILQFVQGHAGGSSQFVQSKYYVSGPIPIPCSIRRIEGMESKFVVMASFPQGSPLFLFDAGCDWSDTTTVERMWPAGKGGAMFDVRDNRTLYLKDLHAALGSDGIHATGDGMLFLENVVTSNLRIGAGRRAWAWQLNPEVILREIDGMRVDGSLRVLGLKTEGLGFNGSETLTVGATGAVEVLGGQMMPCIGQGLADVELGFVVEEGAQFSASYMNSCGKDFDLTTWDRQVCETQGAVERCVLAEALPTYYVEGGHRVSMVLYSTLTESSREAP